jgi:DHA1 family tetracycline resistance protein-like MFS transporter
MPTSRSRLSVIFLTVFIDLAGFGLILPVLPYYAQRFGASAFGYGALIGVFSLTQFVATVLLGGLSDRIGRRPVLLASIAIGAVGYTIFGAAQSYLWLFVARAIAGFAGGNISVAQAYIADVTSPAERSRGMGLVGAAFGLGFIVGPGLGALAAQFGGMRAVGFLGAGLCLMNLASAARVLGESLQPEHRARRPLIDPAHLVRGLTDPVFRAPFLVFGIVPFAFSGYIVALPLYAKEAFGWSAGQLGIFFTIVGVIAALVQGWLFGKIQRRTGDRLLIIVGTLGMAVGIGAIPSAHSGAAIYPWVVVLACANSLAAPALTGLISALSGPKEQGAMLGAAQSLTALGRLSGPLVFGALYDRSGAALTFILAGVVMLVSWMVSIGIRGGRGGPDGLDGPDGRLGEDAVASLGPGGPAGPAVSQSPNAAAASS